MTPASSSARCPADTRPVVAPFSRTRSWTMSAVLSRVMTRRSPGATSTVSGTNRMPETVTVVSTTRPVAGMDSSTAGPPTWEHRAMTLPTATAAPAVMRPRTTPRRSTSRRRSCSGDVARRRDAPWCPASRAASGLLVAGLPVAGAVPAVTARRGGDSVRPGRGPVPPAGMLPAAPLAGAGPAPLAAPLAGLALGLSATELGLPATPLAGPGPAPADGADPGPRGSGSCLSLMVVLRADDGSARPHRPGSDDAPHVRRAPYPPGRTG